MFGDVVKGLGLVGGLMFGMKGTADEDMSSVSGQGSNKCYHLLS